MINRVRKKVTIVRKASKKEKTMNERKKWDYRIAWLESLIVGIGNTLHDDSDLLAENYCSGISDLHQIISWNYSKEGSASLTV